MTSSAEDSDTDSYKDSYLDPSYSYYGFTTSSSSDEEETCMQNLNKEGKILYISRSGSRYLSPGETYVTAMSYLQNNISERIKRYQQSAATSSDEDNSEEDEMKLSSKKGAVKRRQKKKISRRTPIQTATSETQRPSLQLSAALPIAEDNSEEAELNTRPFEKKLQSRKRGSESRSTDQSGSPKKQSQKRL